MEIGLDGTQHDQTGRAARGRALQWGCHTDNCRALNGQDRVSVGAADNISDIISNMISKIFLNDLKIIPK